MQDEFFYIYVLGELVLVILFIWYMFSQHLQPTDTVASVHSLVEINVMHGITLYYCLFAGCA